MITRVGKVIVPVEDQQASLDFWTRCMEFTTVRDDIYGDERWIEVKPPNQDLLLVLSLRRPDEPRRTVPDRLPHSDLFFDCADIEQTHRQFSRRGVKFPLPPSNEQFGWWALFEDNEGSRYALGQWDDQQPQTPDPALRRLDFLVGTWKVEGETAPDFSGPAMRSTSTETFEWLHGGFFLVHRWDAVFGDPKSYAGPELPGGAIQKGIMFYGFDATTGRFRTHFFDGNGPFHDGSMYEGEVVGGNLRFTGPARFTLIENEDGTINNDWELRDDDGEWRPWRHTTMTRVGETDGGPA
jgi:predicted enzyme related to lactoylglutathione lyase